MVRRKKNIKVNSVGTPVDELKGHCACSAEKEEAN